MQDMISKIIEMDEAARKLIENVEKEKLDYEAEVVISEKKIKDTLLSKTKKKIEEFEKAERISTQKDWKRISNKNRSISNNLDRIYNDNFDLWVNKLVEMVIGG